MTTKTINSEDPMGVWSTIETAIDQPTPPQLAALKLYALMYGKAWKELLMERWLGDAPPHPDEHLLRQVRNQLGPEWLINFELEKA